MTQNRALIFPGQGAQYPGMGEEFAKSFLAAREVFEEADELLGRKLSQLIFKGPQEELKETKNSQVAIYVVSMAIHRVLQEQLPGFLPVGCAGLSLGEFTALTVSGRLSFQECLPLVQDRAEAMNAACVATQGTMAAIIGLDGDTVAKMVAALGGELWVANLNCPNQVVISGSLQGVSAGIEAAKELGARRALPLDVHGAFHSGLMRSAQERLKTRMEGVSLGTSKIALAMNVTGEVEWDSERIRVNLIEQVTHTVRWEACIRALVAEGVSEFLEIGPGKVLSGLNQRMKLKPLTRSIETLRDLDHYLEQIQATPAGV